MTELRSALRQTVKRPGFTALVVLTLGLGIGASTAIFTVVHGVLLRQLPYDQPDQIVRILGYRQNEGLTFGTISYPNVVDLREQSRSFAAMAAYDEWRPTLREGPPRRLDGASVNAAFFDVLGVRPAVGRFFRAEEDEQGAAPSVVLSHPFWVQHFGGDTSVVGRELDVSGTMYTVVGVTRADFEDPGLSGRAWGIPQIWRATPSHFHSQLAYRSGRSFTAVARIQSGVTLEQAQAEITALMDGLVEAYPEENADRAIVLRPLRDDMLGNAGTVLWLLFGGVGLVLVIACANVANLMMARAAGRVREVGVRTALGATRWRIGRQLLTESLVLALAGGVAGMLLAVLGTDALVAMAADALPRGVSPALDWRVLVFATGVSILAGVAFGMAPVLEARRVDIGQALRSESRSATSGHRTRRMRAIVATQMALSLTLLVAATLLIRSLWNLWAVDPGVAASGVLTLEVDASARDYPERADVNALHAAIASSIRALPGVREVGAIDILPMSGSFNGMSFSLSDRPDPGPGARPSAEVRSATPQFFDAFDVPVLRGRAFSDADREDTPRVVVVTRSFAQRFFPGGDPIGVRVATMGEEWEIVGVVADIRQFGLARAPEPEIYTPHLQNPHDWMRRDMTLAIRASGDVRRLAGPIREAIWAVAPSVAIENVATMESVVAGTITAQRFRTALFGLFAVLALLLAAVGIYGVVAYAVVQRTHEVGIRLALGARGDRVILALIRDGMRPVLVGGAVGFLGGVMAGRALESLLFEVAPADPLTLAAATVGLAGAGLLACWLPARRATRIHPMEALRYE